MKAAHDDPRPAADVEIAAKAVHWILRHNEFHKPNYVGRHQSPRSKLAEKRLAELTAGKPSWVARPGIDRPRVLLRCARWFRATARDHVAEGV